MTPLRIRLVGMHYAPEPSGNAPYTTALAEGLVRRGHEVSVVTGVPHYPVWKVFDGYGDWRSTTMENGVEVTRLRHHVPRHPTAARRVLMETGFGLRAATQHLAPADVVVCVSPALVSTAVVAARMALARRHTPWGLWVQDLYSVGVVEAAGAGRAMAHGTATLEGRVARAADGVAVVHERFGAHVTARLGIPAERVQVIRNWTHLATVRSDHTEQTRRRHGWADGTVVALHAGNMGVKQGLDNVVEAARLAERDHQDVRFVLLGGGNQHAHLRRLAAGLSNVDFVASLPGEEFQDALAAADVLLVNERPGVNEMSVPSKLTSYYTSGRPVIAACGNGSVTHQEISLSGAGVRVEAGSPDRLLSAVLDIAGNRPAAEAMGGRGKRFVERNLSQDRALDLFEQWLEGLLHPGRKRADRSTAA